MNSSRSCCRRNPGMCGLSLLFLLLWYLLLESISWASLHFYSSAAISELIRFSCFFSGDHDLVGSFRGVILWRRLYHICGEWNRKILSHGSRMDTGDAPPNSIFFLEINSFVVIESSCKTLQDIKTNRLCSLDFD